MRSILALLAVSFLGNFADAQVFPRAPWNKYQSQVSSSCPGGVCPTNASSVLSAPQQRGHWSYPGTIDSHLEGTHGVATTGMTRQQKLNLHDSLHEGATAPTYRTSAYGAPAVVRSMPSQVSYGSAGSVITRSYGSAGSVVQSQYTPVQKLSVINTTPVVQARAIVQSSPQEVRLGLDGFRASLSRAVTEARKDGTLKPREALRLQVRMLSPAFIEQAHDLAVTQIAFSGEANEAVPLDAEGKVNVAGINWDGLIAFLEKLLPLLLKLFSAFGL